MHDAFEHLARRLQLAGESVLGVAREVEGQIEREQRELQQVEYGADDDFDGDLSRIQEEVVEALQDVLERIDQADRALTEARRTLEELPDR